MATLKQQVQEIHKGAQVFAQRAEQYAEQFQDLVSAAHALTIGDS